MKSSLALSVALLGIALAFEIVCLAKGAGTPTLVVGAVFILFAALNLVLDLRRAKR